MSSTYFFSPQVERFRTTRLQEILGDRKSLIEALGAAPQLTAGGSASTAAETPNQDTAIVVAKRPSVTLASASVDNAAAAMAAVAGAASRTVARMDSVPLEELSQHAMVGVFF